MHVEISNNKIINLESLSNYIPTCMSYPILISLLEELHIELAINKNIPADEANRLLDLIKEQLKILNNSSISNEKGKKYTLNPVGHPTYLQSREGIIYLSLLILNICIISVMYAFIVIARVIK